MSHKETKFDEFILCFLADNISLKKRANYNSLQRMLTRFSRMTTPVNLVNGEVSLLVRQIHEQYDYLHAFYGT